MGNTVPPRAKEEEEMRISKLPQSLPVYSRAYYLFHDLYKYASSAPINLVALIPFITILSPNDRACSAILYNPFLVKVKS